MVEKLIVQSERRSITYQMVILTLITTDSNHKIFVWDSANVETFAKGDKETWGDWTLYTQCCLCLWRTGAIKLLKLSLR